MHWALGFTYLFHFVVVVGCGFLGSGGREADSGGWMIVRGRDVGKKRTISTWLYVVVMPFLFVAFTVQTNPPIFKPVESWVL